MDFLEIYAGCFLVVQISSSKSIVVNSVSYLSRSEVS